MNARYCPCFWVQLAAIVFKISCGILFTSSPRFCEGDSMASQAIDNPKVWRRRRASNFWSLQENRAAYIPNINRLIRSMPVKMMEAAPRVMHNNLPKAGIARAGVEGKKYAAGYPLMHCPALTRDCSFRGLPQKKGSRLCKTGSPISRRCSSGLLKKHRMLPSGSKGGVASDWPGLLLRRCEDPCWELISESPVWDSFLNR